MQEAATRTWVLPDEPRPLRLINTVWADRHGVHDGLTSGADVAAWLSATGLVDGRISVTEDSLAQYRAVRSALRRLAALLTDDTRLSADWASHDVSDAVDLINAAAALSPAAELLELHAATLRRRAVRSGRAIDAALTTVATEAIEVLTGEAGARLRACLAPGCVLYFVRDHPRRRWCSTSCGNRARVARHYRRHRDAVATTRAR